MIDLFLPSSENWFFEKFHNLDQRYPTMKAAINLLVQRSGDIIVETGTQRQLEDWGAGCSTTVFGEVCQRYQKTLHAVDNVEKHLNIAKEVTQEYAPFINYHLEDSVTFLHRFRERIDLLYLDSWDYPLRFDYKTEEDYQRAVEDCQQHCLREIKAAHDKLHYNSIVLIDDNDFPEGGKGRLAVNWLMDAERKPKWNIVLDMQQCLLIK